MSPLFRDEVRISLSPTRVAMVQLARGLRAEVVSSISIPCDEQAQGELPWNRALEGMEKMLGTLDGSRPDATVVLSNHFVRYVLAPWSEQISDKDEEQAFIRHCFTKTYGAEAQHWAFRLSPGEFGETQVASAIDQALMDGIERIATARGLRVVSLQPYFMTAFNQWRQRLQGAAVWFVVAERGRLCVSLLEQGKWRSLRALKVGGDWQQALENLLEREYLVSESDAERGTVYLFAPDEAFTASLPNWEVHRLGVNPNVPAVNEMHLAMITSE